MAESKLKIFYTGRDYKNKIFYVVNTCNKKTLALLNKECKNYSVPLYFFGYIQHSSFKDFKKTVRFFIAKKVKVVISERDAIIVIKKLKHTVHN
jgi:hypothetical protein